MIEKALKNTQRTLKTTKKLNEILTALSSKGILRDFECKNGKSLPNVDNLVILSRVLHTSIEDILVVDGDVVMFENRKKCA